MYKNIYVYIYMGKMIVKLLLCTSKCTGVRIADKSETSTIKGDDDEDLDSPLTIGEPGMCGGAKKYSTNQIWREHRK